jgi:hypothetical protein
MSLLFWVDPETSALTLLVDPEELPAGTYEWLSDFGTYSITVAARDRAGNLSLASTPVTVTLPAPALPAAAPNVTTEDRGLGIRVRWPRLTDAVSYQVWRAEDGAGLNAAPRGEPTAALSYLDILATNEADIGPLTWYYKVQGLNLDGPGPLSPNWVQGTASGVSAGWVLFGQMSGNFLEVGTIEADRLAAILTITQLLKTANSGTRWELEGATGDADQMQLRFYLLTTLAMLLDGSGLYFYGSGGQTDFSLARNASNRGQLTMGAMSVGTDATGPFVSIPLTQTGGGGEIRFTGAQASARLREQEFGGASAAGFTKLNGTIGDPALVLYDNVGGGGGNDKLALHWDGISSDNNGIATPYAFRHSGGRWVSNIGARFGGPIVAGASAHPYGYDTYPQQIVLADTLGGTAGDALGLGAEFANTGGGSTMYLRRRFFRGQTNSFWYDARHRWDAVGDNSWVGGGLDIGWRGGSDPYVSLHQGGTAVLYWDHPNTRILVPNNLRVDGTLSKAAGTFDIAHPDEAKSATHRLRHALVEGPTRGENVYTYVVRFGPRGGGLEVEDSEGKAVAGASIKRLDGDGPARWSVEFDLPDYWPHLNERPRCFVQNTGDGWGRAKASVNPALTELTLLAEEGGEYAVLLLGTRKDADARAMWDRRGHTYRQGQRADNSATLERRAARLEERARRDARTRRRAEVPPVPAFSAEGMARAMAAGEAAEAATATSRAMGRAMAAAMKGE